MDILYLILTDAWEVPHRAQWIKILEFINAFDYSSQMCSQDNVLKDCFKFFETASKMFRFHDELIFRLKQEKQSFEKGSLDVSASRCNEAVTSSEAYPKITIHSGASQFSSTESIDEENSSSECTSDSSVSSLDSDL